MTGSYSKGCSGTNFSAASASGKRKGFRYSDVVLPQGCAMAASTWLLSQPEGSIVICRNDPTRHGNAGKNLIMLKINLY